MQDESDTEPKILRILAIDPGQDCGWCVMNVSVTGPWCVEIGSGRFDGDLLTRVNAYNEFVQGLLAQYQPDVLAYELATPSYYHGSVMQGALVSVLASAAKQVPAHYAAYPNSIKKIFTGRGRATKEDMVSHAMTMLGDMVGTGGRSISHHQADAVAIGYCAAFCHGVTIPRFDQVRFA